MKVIVFTDNKAKWDTLVKDFINPLNPFWKEFEDEEYINIHYTHRAYEDEVQRNQHTIIRRSSEALLTNRMRGVRSSLIFIDECIVDQMTDEIWSTLSNCTFWGEPSENTLESYLLGSFHWNIIEF